jgi:hypothetical protein
MRMRAVTRIVLVLWNGIYASECTVGLVAAVVLWRAHGARRRSSTTS